MQQNFFPVLRPILDICCKSFPDQAFIEFASYLRTKRVAEKNNTANYTPHSSRGRISRLIYVYALFLKYVHESRFTIDNDKVSLKLRSWQLNRNSGEYDRIAFLGKACIADNFLDNSSFATLSNVGFAITSLLSPSTFDEFHAKRRQYLFTADTYICVNCDCVLAEI